MRSKKSSRNSKKEMKTLKTWPKGQGKKTAAKDLYLSQSAPKVISTIPMRHSRSIMSH